MNPNDPQSSTAAGLAGGFPTGATADLPLRRPCGGRMVGGVAAGVADHLGIDVTIVRVVIAVLCIVGGAGVPLYLAGWLLIPDETTGTSIAADLLGHVH